MFIRHFINAFFTTVCCALLEADESVRSIVVRTSRSYEDGQPEKRPYINRPLPATAGAGVIEAYSSETIAESIGTYHQQYIVYHAQVI